MSFLFLPFIAFILFGLLIIGYHFFKKDALFVFAIGCIIASNIYNIGTYPLQVGSFTFGVDSVLYTVFVFCILLAYIDFGKKDAMTITYTAMASTTLTAIINFIALWATSGVIGENITWSLISYIFSVIGTYIAIVIMIKCIEKLKNNYLKIFVGILVASIINSIVYFGLIALATLSIETNFLGNLLGSYLGKFMTLLFTFIAYSIICTLKKKKTPPQDSLNEKYDLEN